jgi:hypothetical protein
MKVIDDGKTIEGCTQQHSPLAAVNTEFIEKEEIKEAKGAYSA